MIYKCLGVESNRSFRISQGVGPGGKEKPISQNGLLSPYRHPGAGRDLYNEADIDSGFRRNDEKGKIDKQIIEAKKSQKRQNEKKDNR